MSNDDDRRTVKTSIPITWGSGPKDPRTGNFKHQINSEASLIKEVSTRDIATFADQTATTCGSCKHFRPPTKDRPEVKGFLARAIHEANWRLGYMGHTPENLSRCRENADVLVGVNSKSCPHYKPGNGGLR